MIIDIPENSDFSIHNIPFGIFSTQDRSPRIGVAIGAHILDLAAVAELDVFDFNTALLEKDTLNDFISLALGKFRQNFEWNNQHIPFRGNCG